jgi:hypothetical protein
MTTRRLVAAHVADWGECCFCRNDTRTLWTSDGARVAYACTADHLVREYPDVYPERRSEFVDRRGSDSLDKVLAKIDWTADRLLSESDWGAVTDALGALDEIRIALSGKPCQPVEGERL